MSSSLDELQKMGLIDRASFEVRTHPTSAHFKCYILNRREAFFGFYPVTEHQVTYKGQDLPMWDLVGKDAALFHYTRGDDETMGGLFIEQAQGWFDSMWNHLGQSAPAVSETLQQLMARVRCVLLDFDGPVCSSLRRLARARGRRVGTVSATSRGIAAWRGGHDGE